jgi:hypothetical protein
MSIVQAPELFNGIVLIANGIEHKFMSTLSRATSRASKRLSHKAKTAAVSQTTFVNNAESASIGADFALPDHSSDQSFAAAQLPPQAAKARSFTYFGGIAEGHYTEF